MEITFLIGNGFDINAGLKTDFPSFWKYYLNLPSDNEYIKAFKELISGNLQYWSDLEKALGEQTTEYPLSDEMGFLTCKEDLDISLRNYLLNEQQKVDEIQFGEKEGMELNKALLDGFNTLPPKGQENLKNSFSNESRNYNVLVFNYTNLFDKFFAKVPIVMRHRGGYADNKGRCIHLHGTLNEAMLVGVNDVSQIKNPTIAKKEDVVQCMVKPQMNAYCGLLRDNAARNIIRVSRIICIYGMSIGATDKIWWQEIARVLKSNNNVKLVIFSWSKEINKPFPYLERRLVNKEIKKFEQLSGLSGVEFDQIRGQIEVKFNSDIFNFVHNLKSKKLLTV